MSYFILHPSISKGSGNDAGGAADDARSTIPIADAKYDETTKDAKCDSGHETNDIRST